MNNTDIHPSTDRKQPSLWLPVVLGFSVLYGPSLFDLIRGVWSTDAQMHGPVVLSLSIWLLYKNWPTMLSAGKGAAPSALGWPLAVLSLTMYALGRSQDILVLEIGSVMGLIASFILLNFGTRALKAQWFALFFMLFMVPLPGLVVDTLTMPMKIAVSYVAEHVLYWVGYPIARSGVMLHVGQYMPPAADACAGLHTLLTLEALGLLYLSLVKGNSMFRNITLALLIVPISLTANVIRVIVLTLVTYHFGDDAGQGFLHGFAGMVLFLSALLLILGTDALLRNIPPVWLPVRRVKSLAL
jgi:exosortase B